MSTGHLSWRALPDMGDRRVSVTRHVLAPGAEDNGPHDHDFVEIGFVTGGHGVHRTIYGGRQVMSGTAVVVRPGAWHIYEDFEQLAVTNCSFTSAMLEHELAWLVEQPTLRALLWGSPSSLQRADIVQVQLDESAFRRCQAQLDALETLQWAGEDGLRASAVAYLLLLLSGVVSALTPAQLRDITRASSAHEVVVEATRLLRERTAHPWTLDELARVLSISSPHLTRLFRQALDISPMAYLARLRAEAGATMLLSSDRSITAIAADVGWPDPNYFARRFKAHFGQNPTAYRARHRSAPGTGERVAASAA